MIGWIDAILLVQKPAYLPHPISSPFIDRLSAAIPTYLLVTCLIDLSILLFLIFFTNRQSVCYLIAHLFVSHLLFFLLVYQFCLPTYRYFKLTTK